MEKIEKFRKVIHEVMNEYASYFKVVSPDLKYEFILDPENHHYQLLRIGWHNRKRVHFLVFHLDIIDGKIWIQQDNTETGIAYDLVKKGIAKSEIVLAYFSPSHRKYTDFAVA
ncbi:MAG: XisI protein [Bacteroidia bacterium]